MALDFTFDKYTELLFVLKRKKYVFYTFKDVAFSDKLYTPHVILRHDVDRLPFRALKLARLEYELGISSTYFFRIKSVSFNENIIGQILKFRHEIGYHYEELSDTRGNLDLAWQLFQKNIKKFDKFGGITSIAMHGKPFSKWNNQNLWNKYDYKKLGIKIEVYRDIPWDNYLYFTDVGRCWNSKNNIRDRIGFQTNLNIYWIKTTDDLIEYITQSCHNLIISTHPERWTDNKIGWLQVIFTDSLVNLLKKLIRKKEKNENYST